MLEYLPLLFLILFIAGIYFLLQKRNKQKEEIDQIRLTSFANTITTQGDKYALSGIPEINSDIKLKKSEKVYIKLSGVKWLESRKVGTAQISKESINQITPLDVGILHVTNTGFIFRGNNGNRTVLFEKIIMINFGVNHVQLERNTGKDIYLQYNFMAEPNSLAAIIVAWNKDYFKELSDSEISQEPKGVINLAGVNFSGSEGENRKQAFKESNVGDTVVIKFDIGNSHDPNALGVYTTSGNLLGFVPKGNYELISEVRRMGKMMAVIIHKNQFYSSNYQVSEIKVKKY